MDELDKAKSDSPEDQYVQIARVAKLPTGLELWAGKRRDGTFGAYTIPARSNAKDITETFRQVKRWSETAHVAYPEALDIWLDIFEDQHQYLSGNMPQRQQREVWAESANEVLQELYGKEPRKAT